MPYAKAGTALAVGLLNLLPAWSLAQTQKSVSDFAAIRPILQARCTVCHNREMLSNASVSGGLDLSTPDALKRGVEVKGGFRSILAASGKGGVCSLIERLNAISPSRMMPKGGPPLSPPQIALFSRWIAAGAPAGAAPVVAVVSVPAAPAPLPAGTTNVLFSTSLHAAPAQLAKPVTPPPSVRYALKIGPAPAITALAFSPDGNLLAVGAYRSVTLWNLHDGKAVACINYLPGQIQCLAFRPDGVQLAIGGGTPGLPSEVRIFDVKGPGELGPRLKGHTEVTLSIAWSPDGKLIATGSQDRSSRIWEWPGGKELKNFKEHGDAVSRVCFSPDGKSLYTASLDHNIRRYEIATGALMRTYAGHAEAVAALAVSADGKRLVSAGIEPALKWWNAETGDATGAQGGHGGPVNEISLSKDGKTVVSVSADKTLKTWDAIGTGQQRSFAGAADWLYAGAISPDAKLVAGAGAEGIVWLWDISGRLRLSLISWPLPKTQEPLWLAVSPEGYYDGSQSWTALLLPELTGNALPSPALAAWVKTLQKPEMISRSWQGLPVEPAKP